MDEIKIEDIVKWSKNYWISYQHKMVETPEEERHAVIIKGGGNKWVPKHKRYNQVMEYASISMSLDKEYRVMLGRFIKYQGKSLKKAIETYNKL